MECTSFVGKEKLQELSAVESLLFDLSIVKSATANFSEVNKLGQGGFGSVYKVPLYRAILAGT